MNEVRKAYYDVKRTGDSLPEVTIRFAQFILRILNKAIMPLFWAKVRIETKAQVEKINRPLLIIANHKSYYDPLLIADSLPVFSDAYPLRFIAKDQLFESPISAFVFRLMGSFPTYYGNGVEKSLETPYEILKNGGSVVFFPEGKCIREDGLGEGKPGAAILALKVPDIQILPIALRSSYKIGRLGFMKKPQVEVVIGKPFLLKDKINILDATPEFVTDIFMETLRNLYLESEGKND